MSMEEKIMFIAKRVPRFNFNGFLYVSLARESLEKYNKAKTELQKISGKGKKSNEKFHLEEEMKKNHIIVITFAAMFLEAAIWDYGASKKSVSFVKRFKSHKDKWLRIPKAVCDQEIPKNSTAMQLLQRLIEARNDIVHSRTQPPPKDFEELRSIVRKENMSLMISADEAFHCMAECINELQKIDGKWWLFNTLTGNALIGRMLLPGFKVIRKNKS